MDVVLAFDLYATLLSTTSIARQLEAHVGRDKSDGVAASWRTYQLEYTWRMNSMGRYEPFSSITLRSLKHALKDAHVDLDQPALDSIMEAYDSLDTFPDVGPMLNTLGQTPSITPVIFSNGTYKMVSNSVHRSPSLSPHAELFKQILVVEDVGRYKPAPEVYRMLAEKVGKEAKDVWLISSNPFDVVGASSFGMQTAWVDRAGHGWADQLVEGDAGTPTTIVRDLGGLVEAVQKHMGTK